MVPRDSSSLPSSLDLLSFVTADPPSESSKLEDLVESPGMVLIGSAFEVVGSVWSAVLVLSEKLESSTDEGREVGEGSTTSAEIVTSSLQTSPARLTVAFASPTFLFLTSYAV